MRCLRSEDGHSDEAAEEEEEDQILLIQKQAALSSFGSSSYDYGYNAYVNGVLQGVERPASGDCVGLL